MPSVTIHQIEKFKCDVEYGAGIPLLRTDEPSPLGEGTGPTPAQLLASAVGNCLLDSFYFALSKFKNTPNPLRCEVNAEVGRDADGKLRVLSIDATLHLSNTADELNQLDRALEQFESFCTVTQSVRAAIPIQVKVMDKNGLGLK
ncbi:MAG: OsmC family protein [Limnobacter sp.]|jgi:uncharacterized OsmC-like protein|uniref:OsmC family protein n=1 Tax=Limnobacter sp. TaxID=2003368 RepID=UPI004037E3AB